MPTAASRRREHHERDEDAGQLDVLARARLDLLPHDGVGRRALGVLDGPLGVLGDLRVDRLDRDRAVARGSPSSLRSEMTTLASSRATSARITSPCGLRGGARRGARRCRPIPSRSSSSSAPLGLAAAGVTIRRWITGRELPGRGPPGAPGSAVSRRRTPRAPRRRCPGSPRTRRRCRARRTACTRRADRPRSRRRAGRPRCGTSTCGRRGRAGGRGGPARSAAASLRSRSSTSPSPLTSSAVPSPLASVPVVGTMYGFHGPTTSAYSAISSSPALVAKYPYVRLVRRRIPRHGPVVGPQARSPRRRGCRRGRRPRRRRAGRA